MHRFFVSPELLKEAGAIVFLPKELAHQVRDVLRLPELLPICPLMHALNAIPQDALAIMPWEEERNQPLRYVLNSTVGKKNTVSPAMSAGSIAPPPVTVVLFIGPEGGFMAEEVKLAQRYGVQVVTLGPRILRAETAALASIANVMYELE